MLTPAQKLARAAAEAAGLSAQDTSDTAEHTSRELRLTLQAMAVPDSVVARASRALVLLAKTELGPISQKELGALGTDAIALAEKALPTFRRIKRSAEAEELRAFNKAPDLAGLLTPEEAKALTESNPRAPMGEAVGAIRHRLGPDVTHQILADLRRHTAAEARAQALEAANAADLEPHERAVKQAQDRKAELAKEIADYTAHREKLDRAEAIKAQRLAEERALAEAEAEKLKAATHAKNASLEALADTLARTEN